MSAEFCILMDAPALQAQTRPYSASGSDTIPSGYSTVVLEAFGATGSGGAGDPAGTTQGGGGASGSYARSSYSVVGSGGETIDFSIGAAPGGTTTISSGTFSITTLTAPGGNSGGNATLTTGGAGGTPGASGSGGTEANDSGNSGQTGNSPTHSSNLGAGGIGVTGSYATGPTGQSGAFSSSGRAGYAGLVTITYLP